MDKQREATTDHFKSIFNSRKMPAREMVISFLLGLPDGITYGHFGLLCGVFLADKLGLIGAVSGVFSTVFGIGAAAGVACFAMNNVSREYRYVFASKKAVGVNYSCLRARACLRIFCLIVALISVIPFAGMAMTAGSEFGYAFFLLLVVSNTVARFCMNDYALGHVLNHVFDKSYLFILALRRRDAGARLKMLSHLKLIDARFNDMPEDELQQFLLEIERNPTLLFRMSDCAEWSKRTNSVVADVLAVFAFIAGAYTATYLYWFSLQASSHILAGFHLHSHAMAVILAVSGVVPTAFLWGSDTAKAVSIIYKKASEYFQGKQKPACLHSPLLRYKSAACLFGLILLAFTGAVSETHMANVFLADQQNRYVTLMSFFAPIAFLGIYSVGVVQVIEKAFAYLDSIWYPTHPATAYQNLLEGSQQAGTFVQRIRQMDVEMLYLDVIEEQ